MGKSKQSQVEKFGIEGRLLSWVMQERKLQRINIATAEGEYHLKLSKKLRCSLTQTVVPGDWVQVTGKKKVLKTGKVKLRASQVTRSVPNLSAPFPQPLAQATEPKCKILVCQKSPCVKRGSLEAYQALETTLRDRGLADQVCLKTTGCMNRCKAGPNMILMPGKHRFTNVRPEEVPGLIAEHFSTEADSGKISH